VPLTTAREHDCTNTCAGKASKIKRALLGRNATLLKSVATWQKGRPVRRADGRPWQILLKLGYYVMLLCFPLLAIVLGI